MSTNPRKKQRRKQGTCWCEKKEVPKEMFHFPNTCIICFQFYNNSGCKGYHQNEEIITKDEISNKIFLPLYSQIKKDSIFLFTILIARKILMPFSFSDSL